MTQIARKKRISVKKRKNPKPAEKGLQIFMQRIWPKRASDLCVESDWKRPSNIYTYVESSVGIFCQVLGCAKGWYIHIKLLRSMSWIWLKKSSTYYCVESDQEGRTLIYAHRTWLKKASKYLYAESDQKGLQLCMYNLNKKHQLIQKKSYPRK